MDLTGAGGDYRWTSSSWRDLLALAEHYGWRGTGTGVPRGTLKADWTGEYDCNDGALFYARDSRAFADALEAMLADQPSKAAEKLEGVRHYGWYCSKEGKEALREFIEYCRKGSFRIH